MNQAFFERLINAACTAVGVALASTLDVHYIALGVFMVCMSFPDCLGFFTPESYEFTMEEQAELDS